MNEYKTPIVSYVFAGIGALGFFAGVFLMVGNKATEAAFWAGLYSLLGSLPCFAVGFALDYLAKAAHYAEQTVGRIDALQFRSGKK